MIDYRKIMEERDIQEPIPTQIPSQFPASEELPEGCHVLSNLPKDWGYKMDIHTDVVYANRDGMDLHVIILEPKDSFDSLRKWPCVAYIQGSAFHKQNLWDNISRHIRLVEKGYVVAIIEYRPSDVSPFPAQMCDAKSAIRFLKKNAEQYHIDLDRMAVAGDSSGAHTALLVGITGDEGPDTDLYSEYSVKVNCIVDSYAPTAFMLMNYYPSSHDHIGPNSPEGMEIGKKNVLENLDEAEKASPMYYLSKDKPTPPTLILHGDRDMLVPFHQSCLLYNYMKELGKDVTFYKLINANHGFDGFNSDVILNIVVDFLQKNIG